MLELCFVEAQPKKPAVTYFNHLPVLKKTFEHYLWGKVDGIIVDVVGEHGIQVPSIVHESFKSMVKASLKNFISSVSMGKSQELRLAAGHEAPWRRREALYNQLSHHLDGLNFFLAQDIFNASLRSVVRQQMQFVP